ncbi:Rhamnose utilisation protein RhaD, predicted bifunctional aldolase and dehydrogenase [Alkalispirochaeta americana]|uniref:Rhamnose utilisation protein RhaD, predicted bifunctional aldolase and dehydrogenase n=1 Tax=Alkalispirochaeta americana TaxID=159291 RepID=A0A1N6RHQ6_9SPIO|nr:class II aldolase/adducin family protein [Alkalispirochaeta americana]SIQ28337.1 Rhamnose utilisation protein RhaD, predicted bifunctional aldolase and dehydrogenase [Alkalispirochaeta americana]
MNNHDIEEIVQLSREIGQSPRGAGSTRGIVSIKDEKTLALSEPGHVLTDLGPEHFRRLDRAHLDSIAPPRNPPILEDLIAETETLMHALFPRRIVFHTHPTELNGLTCSREGAAAARELFGDRALWIPTVNPGYILARTIYDLVEQWRADHDGAYPSLLIMQNHGLVVTGDTADDIRNAHREVTEALERAITIRPDTREGETDPFFLEDLRDYAAHAVAEYRAAHGDSLNPPETITFTSPELISRATSPETFAPLTGALTPDHIVYSGHRPCYISPVSREALRAEVHSEILEFCYAQDATPRIVVAGDLGAVALGDTEKKARLAMELFLDALKVTRLAENFGGVQAMPDDQVEFIRTWEVEQFREAVSTAGN